MRLLIGIATFKRTSKLKKCIDSILNSTYKDVHIEVVADNNDWDTIQFLHDNYNTAIVKMVQDKHCYVIGAWNRVVQENIKYKYWDGYIGLCDDVQVSQFALQNIVEIHKICFPDTDGVCGFNQVCEGHPEYSFKWFGQTLIGRKFIERYKDVNYKICCDAYSHFFQDEEMHQYATSLNKFVNCEMATLIHDHPSFTGSIDEAHNIIRSGINSPKEHDLKIYQERKRLGLLWPYA